MTEKRTIEEILSPGRNCLGIFESHLCGIYIDAAEYYRAFVAAAKEAKRYILIAGWQFDSEVRLVRGEDSPSDLPEAKSLLAFLNYLCRRNPELRVYILAWDYSAIFALEREWFQSLVFRWKTLPQVRFRFDAAHAVGASHHQKFVVFDGAIGFAGGMDICAGRWDDRNHRPGNPLRIDSRGKPFGPYHDVQACVTGPAAAALAEIFKTRWADSGPDGLDLPGGDTPGGPLPQPPLLIGSSLVALSRTEGETLIPLREAVREIRQLYIDAIATAGSHIYIENQYFCSQAIYGALIQRMSDRNRPQLGIVIVMPKKIYGVIEGLSMGLAQARMLSSLKETAVRTGHSLGIYHPESGGPAETAPVYVHSKIMIVDDRFLTVGSANASNRSMGLDTELNLSWEVTTSDADSLSQSIRRLRTDLLREHTGKHDGPFDDASGLVNLLDRMADAGQSGLIPIEARDYLAGNRWLRDIPARELAIDPEGPVVEENIFEVVAHDKSGRLARLLLVINRLLGREAAASLGDRKRKDSRRAGRLSLLGKAMFAGLVLLLILVFAAAAFLVTSIH